MPLIKNRALLIPRGTSQLMIVPGYEKALVQARFNAGQADRDKWVKELPEIPKDLPAAATAENRDMEAEMERLAATYGVDAFRRFYPSDELFEQAFNACQTIQLNTQVGAVPEGAPTPQLLIEEFLDLKVPSLSAEKAAKLVDAGYTRETMDKADVRTVSSLTGLSHNLIRATIDAARANPEPAVPRGAPSAPTGLHVTSVEAPGIQ